MTAETPEDNTLRHELRATIAEWREKQEQLDLPRSGLTDEGQVYKECADEIEDLLE